MREAVRLGEVPQDILKVMAGELVEEEPLLPEGLPARD